MYPFGGGFQRRSVTLWPSVRSPFTTIEEFSRGNGTVLIALRSLDWCAYCKRQIIDLQEYKSYFDVFGIGLVAITNDHPGAIIVNRDGIITGKLFVENPNLRVFSSEMLDYAKQSRGLKGLF